MLFRDEAELLSQALRLPSFERFYDYERGRLSTPLLWTIDESLESRGLLGTCTAIADSAGQWGYLIRLPAQPENEYDAFVSAHEVGHAVLDHEGFPGVYTLRPNVPGIQALTAPLRSVLQDALIDQRLRRYFDVARLELANDPRFVSPGGFYDCMTGLARAACVLSYVYIALRWRALDAGRSLPSLVVFQHRSPGIAREGDEVIRTIQGIGYETPEQHTRILDLLIRRYALARYVVRTKQNAPAFQLEHRFEQALPELRGG